MGFIAMAALTRLGSIPDRSRPAAAAKLPGDCTPPPPAELLLLLPIPALKTLWKFCHSCACWAKWACPICDWGVCSGEPNTFPTEGACGCVCIVCGCGCCL